jgi:hypothetical protein
MKTIVLGALLLASFFTASAQQVPSAPSKMRYGVYFDFGWTPTLNIGGAASYSLVKWANLRAEAGVLFLLGTVTTLASSSSAVYDYNRPTLHTPHSIHLGRLLSIDLNVRALSVKGHEGANLFFAPGISFRNDRFEIRTRVSHVESVNVGLAYFFPKKK